MLMTAATLESLYLVPHHVSLKLVKKVEACPTFYFSRVIFLLYHKQLGIMLDWGIETWRIVHINYAFVSYAH